MNLPARRHLCARGSVFASTYLVGTALFLILGLTLAQARISLEALRQDGYGLVPLKRPRPNVLTVLAQIDGRKQTLIVDTGWGRTGISLHADPGFARGSAAEKRESFGTSASGAKMTLLRRGVANVVRMGGIELTQVPLEYSDIHLGAGASGVLSGGFLETCSAIIDLQNLQLYLRPPGKGHRALLGPALLAAGLSEAPMGLQQHHAFVEVEINDFHGYMAIDTGAELAGVDSSLAPKLKAALYKSGTGYVDAAGKVRRSTLAKLRSFKIAGVPVQAPGLRFADFPFYAQSGGKVMGLLGINILGSNGAIIDFGARKLYFYKSE